jgi:hypothetical protein
MDFIILVMITAFSLLSLLAHQVNSATLDMITGTQVTGWLEAGFSLIDDATWVKVSTTGPAWRDPVIFTSLPDIGGVTYDLGVPTATRIKDVVFDDGGKTSFYFKVSAYSRTISYLTPL